MRFEKYNSELYPALAVAARKINLASLLRRDFVDYYYQGQPWSELCLAFDEDDRCAAFIGFDRLRFECEGQEMSIGMATNFYTLKSGMGGFLWIKWMKSCGVGLVFGGSEDTHRILRKQKFAYYQGVNVYKMNARYSAYDTDPAWRSGLKRVLRTVTQKPLKTYETRAFLKKSESITVEEIQSRDAKRIESSCFSFRFAPTEEYMHWRYDSSLPFVRYRWFEIFADGKRVGYCVLNDAPEQIIVAHSDGTDPEKLAYGILKAVLLTSQKDTKKRTSLLASSHPIMQKIFIEHGFALDLADRPTAIGSLRSTLNLPEPQSWLMNFGLGDNDLRLSNFYS